ncbi:MAG TPA: antibiotic biosynthesis monooxygenase [Candidatus Cybelea sp.]|nr:antibiotic biosynthesis monooxygenase [Candidatus Cybelea sp.]
MAFVRIGQFKARTGTIEEICRTYERDAIPIIRAAEGNISAVLLQQHESPDTFMAITVWQSRGDAETYERSGLAQQMVEKIRHAFAGPPTLLTYDAYGI